MKKKHKFILLFIILLLNLYACGKNTSTESVTVEHNSSTTPIATEENKKVGAQVETESEIPLEVTFQSKEYKYYDDATELFFYFKIRNASENNLKSPLVGADLLDASGNIVYSEGFNHMGVLAPGQQFDGFLSIDNNNEYWDNRDNISEVRLVYYMDDNHDLYTLDDPVIVPIT